ncbi:MAG: hypothetical protein EOO27_02885 [Comamonadaceae bacterium]|nr:MAG: hypothetical protein EOO27_02885 [Comamonadaceae bacterium]
MWQTRNAHDRARAAEERADKLQDEQRLARLRDEELEAIGAISRGADLFIGAIRRYYDITFSYLEAADTQSNHISVVAVQADMADSISDAVRMINLAMINLETEQLIEESVLLNSHLMAIKQDIADMPPEKSSADDVRELINSSTATISMSKDNLFHIARRTHSTTDIYKILAKLTAQANSVERNAVRSSNEHVGGPA